MTTTRNLSKKVRACIAVTAVLPWYGLLTGNFLLYVLVLTAAARAGTVVFATFWVGIIPLAVLILLVSPALLIAFTVQDGDLPKPLTALALAGAAATLTLAGTFAVLSGWMAVRNAADDPGFAALAGVNAALLACGTRCASITLKTLRHSLREDHRAGRPHQPAETEQRPPRRNRPAGGISE